MYLTKFDSNYQTAILPKVFEITKIIAIIKPNKPRDKLEGYSEIALLSCYYNLLDR